MTDSGNNANAAPAAADRAEGGRADTVLITGASAGIGRELAKLFAADGARLVLVARRQDMLSELAAELAENHGTDAHLIPADLSRAGGPGDVARALEERHID